MAQSSLPVLLARNLTAKSVHGAFWDMFAALLLESIFGLLFSHHYFFLRQRQTILWKDLGVFTEFKEELRIQGGKEAGWPGSLGSRNSWIGP